MWNEPVLSCYTTPDYNHIQFKDRRDSIFHKIFRNVRIDYSSILRGEPCWIWKGRDSGNGRGGGYGRVEIGGTTMAVHRVMYTHYYGIIPHKKEIDHACSNRRCCNPVHLDCVTPKKNAKLRAKRNKEKK